MRCPECQKLACNECGYCGCEDKNKMEWISVKDKLPKENQTVKIKLKETEAMATYQSKFPVLGCNWVIEDIDDIFLPVKITHWMPLTEPPIA